MALDGPVRFPALRAESVSASDAWNAYAEAALRLAEAELAEAESQNRRMAGSVSEYDVKRLQAHRDFARQSREFLRQGGDFGALIHRYAKVNAELAELELAVAEAARRQDAAAVSEERIECLRRNAEVGRLEVLLVDKAAGETSGVGHLHWETHRLRAEVMRLNRRLERLEELVSSR
jgi:hypothetical protein